MVMHLGLAPTSIVLQDGFANWNACAADAVATWNGYLDFVTFSSVSSTTVSQVSGDGINSVFFSNTIFGDSFDDSTIAVTVIETTANSQKVTSEADVVVNTAYRFDSYRGPQQSDARGDVIDLHRVLLHEFGHVLGLDHVTFPTLGLAIMEPNISDMDHPATDDVDGIRFLYGAKVSYPDLGDIKLGDTLSLSPSEPNNSPTSYSAIDLPPGLTLDAPKGTISGKVTTAGEYNSVVIAHGPFADAYASFSTTVVGLNEVPGLLSIIKGFGGNYLTGDPYRPRIYAATDKGIELINTNSGGIRLLSPGHDLPYHLSISADGSILYFRQEFKTTLHRLDLETLTELPTLSIPSGESAVLEGLDNRAYTTGAGGVYQFDVTTGTMELKFGPTLYPQIAITPDRKTLVVTTTDGPVSTYDISTASPSFLATHDGSFNGTVVAPDNSRIYCRNPSSAGGSMAELPLPGLTKVRYFGAPGNTAYISVGPDGSIYQTREPILNIVSIFDPNSLRLSGELDITHPPFTAYQFYDILFDSSTNDFFALAASYGQTELWKFSTDFASFPPADPIATQNLTNISTRAVSGSDADAMIGGFIIQGNEPKKVLLRGIGPSLPVSGALSDPVLDLYDSTGKLVATNDNWTTNRLAIIGTQLQPGSAREAALQITLQPGAYTAMVHDTKGQVGSALLEVYDLAPTHSLLANISTRGKVGTGNDVMIGGFVIGGTEPTKVLVRALGPSLSANGVTGALADPVLELHDVNGDLIQTNDNWRSSGEAAISATGLAPRNDLESAILATLQPESYTAIVRGHDNTTGVALVEIYNLGNTNNTGK